MRGDDLAPLRWFVYAAAFVIASAAVIATAIGVIWKILSWFW